MKILGNPNETNSNLICRIKNVLEFTPKPLELDQNFFSRIIEPGMDVLDIGSSLREKESLVRSMVKVFHTLDINVFEDYPDIQMDLCEKLDLSSQSRYDVIFCFSLLEHCYNPFAACENLFQLVKPGGIIVGSVPFLFPHHCPEDLIYQDYFRFTKYSFVPLFPGAEKISVFPQRGRVGAGLNIISQRYKDWIEKKSVWISNRLNKIDQERRPEQSSGFDFIVNKPKAANNYLLD
jgi:SAM-dependent methyltransferase